MKKIVDFEINPFITDVRPTWDPDEDLGLNIDQISLFKNYCLKIS